MVTLAGDVGGTKTALRIYGAGGTVVREHTYESADYRDLESVVGAFLAEGGDRGGRGEVSAACFGVPGPVVDGTARTTNLPWTVSAASLSSAVGIPAVVVVNDLALVAAALPVLGDPDLWCVRAGAGSAARDDAAARHRRVPSGVRVVVAPGTGLGQAAYVPADRPGARPVVLSSEGGHVDFAPADDGEVGLWRHLRAKFGRVSAERVLSGPGIESLYDYYAGLPDAGADPAVRERAVSEDLAALVTEYGLSGGDRAAEAALGTFIGCLGAHAGNMALAFAATGGVYLGGGIPRKILPAFADGRFSKRFLDKDRLSSFLEGVPVHVITDPAAALRGAAVLAAAAETE